MRETKGERKRNRERDRESVKIVQREKYIYGTGPLNF